jgi:hypothetical protein
MDVFDAFAKTVLTPQASEWDYHPEPLEVTDSYEARRYVAPSAKTELFEYDWSFLMTSARYAGFAAAFVRVFLRRPRHVPDTPSIGFCSMPLTASGAGTPMMSSSVGVRSMRWVNCERTPP